MSVADRPFISVVIPTFKKPEPLRETLASLRQLDYPTDRCEIIVVDDGPDHETESIVDAAGSDPPPIRYLAQTHGGAATARNHGAREASSEVVVFLDDDMLVPPDLIARHLDALAQQAPAIVCGYREFAPEPATRLRSTPLAVFDSRSSRSRNGATPARRRTHSETGAYRIPWACRPTISRFAGTTSSGSEDSTRNFRTPVTKTRSSFCERGWPAMPAW